MLNILPYCFKRCLLFIWQSLKWHLLNARDFFSMCFSDINSCHLYNNLRRQRGRHYCPTHEPSVHPKRHCSLGRQSHVDWQWGPVVAGKPPSFWMLPNTSRALRNDRLWNAPSWASLSLLHLPLLLHSHSSKNYPHHLPWVVWLSGLGIFLQTKRLPASSIPSQDMCLGCGPGPQVGVYERQPINISLAHLLLPSL